MKIPASINESEWSYIKDIGTTIYLKKNEIIFKEGEKTNKEIFIENGVIRGFIVDEAGNEKIT